MTAGAQQGRSLPAIRKSCVKPPRRKAEPDSPLFPDADALDLQLAACVQAGDVRGPFNKTKTNQFYFAAAFGPTTDAVRGAVCALARESGAHLLSRGQLEKKITGFDKPYLADAIAAAIAGRELMELKVGATRLYLSRDAAVEAFGWAQPSQAPPRALGFEELGAAYKRLKAEQGGFSAVKIFDLLHALQVDKSALHETLIAEARAGRAILHPTTSVGLPPEVLQAGLRFPNRPELLITVVLKEDR